MSRRPAASTPATRKQQMLEIIVTAFVSADGVMEAPGGEPGYRDAGWTFRDGRAGSSPTR